MYLCGCRFSYVQRAYACFSKLLGLFSQTLNLCKWSNRGSPYFWPKSHSRFTSAVFRLQYLQALDILLLIIKNKRNAERVTLPVLLSTAINTRLYCHQSWIMGVWSLGLLGHHTLSWSLKSAQDNFDNLHTQLLCWGR